MKKIILAMTLSSLVATSCSTVRSQTYEKIMVSSNPIGASINIDGYACGPTPQVIEVDTKNTHRITLEMEGYHARDYLLKPTLSVRKLSSNALFPICCAAIGAGAGLIATGGVTAGLAGIDILLGLAAGIAVGGVLGVTGLGIDLCSGKAKKIPVKEIKGELIPLTPY